MWFLVDAADPDRALSSTLDEGIARERSLIRAIRPNSLAAAANSAIAQVLSSNRPASRDLWVRGGDREILAIPVPGPDDETLAVQLWAGPRRRPGRDEPPPIDAFVWDGGEWTLMSGGRGGAVLPARHRLLHGAWFLSRIIECEERDQLMTAVLDPNPDTVWEGPMRVLTPDDAHTTRIFGTFRYHARNRLRALLLQIEEDRKPGIVLPTYHNDAAAALLGGTTALMDLLTMQILEWLTPPLPEIAWRHHPQSHDTDPTDRRSTFNLTNTHLVHPDDRASNRQTYLDLAEGRIETAERTFRLLTVSGGWQAVQISWVPIPHALPRFRAMLFRPVGNPVP
ncbi:GAF domain-containing protein [Nocardia brasiliensis]|uniref:GAF domain-containing protein n=1 Tax=Nocardia brasiliensis TaxID=37326 RepID=UPI0036729F28